MKDEILQSINQVVATYFEENEGVNILAAKELMPKCIEAGLFLKDEKKGLPLRKVLRVMNEQNALDKIPSVHAERKDKNTYWYFVREGFTYVSEAPNDTGVKKKKKTRKVNAESDEHYLINLSDELLSDVASRHHKFGFILGDYHKDGKTRSALPVDAYYPKYNLVIELIKPVSAISIDRPNHKTISGVTRSDQRAIYAERKKNGLLAKGVNFIEIQYASFKYEDDNGLVRNKENDLDVMRGLLKDFLKEEGA